MAAEFLGRQQFHHLAGLDPARRRSDHDEVGRSRTKLCAQLGDVDAFASHAAEVFQRLGEERSHLLPGIGDADARHHAVPREGSKLGRVLGSLIVHGATLYWRVVPILERRQFRSVNFSNKHGQLFE